MSACTLERIFDTKVIILHPSLSFLSFEYVGCRINVPELLLQTSVLRLFPYPEPWTLLKLSVKVFFVWIKNLPSCKVGARFRVGYLNPKQSYLNHDLSLRMHFYYTLLLLSFCCPDQIWLSLNGKTAHRNCLISEKINKLKYI